MGDPKREELSVSSQRAILVGVFHPDSGFTRDNALDELKGLVKTAGVHVVGVQTAFEVVKSKVALPASQPDSFHVINLQ